MTAGPPRGGSSPPRTSFLRHLDRAEEYFGVALLVALGILLSAQVFMRFVLGLGYSWMEEIIRMLFIWVIFVGAVAAMRRNLHIRVEAGLLLLPKPVRPFAGDAAEDHPLFQRYTDIEDFRNFPDALQPGETVVMTEKVHGTNARVGIVQGVNERLDEWSVRTRGRPLTRMHHAIVAASAVILSGLLSSFGLVALVARGYGTMAWVFLLVYVVPLMTRGIGALARSGPPVAATVAAGDASSKWRAHGQRRAQ